jgi:ribosomal protein L37AE/L43A
VTEVVAVSEAAEVVWTCRSENSRQHFHLRRDCPQLPKDDSRVRTVEREKLNQSYHLCSDCDPDHDRDRESMGTMTCPQCGETVQTGSLRYHLPCGGDADA